MMPSRSNSFLSSPGAILAGMGDAASSRRWPARIAFILVCIGFSLQPWLHTQRSPTKNKDFDLWYKVGQRVVAGESLYPEDANQHFGYIYPPTLAIFLYAPLTMLGYTAFVSILLVGNSLIWYAALRFGLKLFTGSDNPERQWVLLVPFVATAPYVYDTFLLGQVNLGLLLLMMVMFWGLRTDRPYLAGGALAVAAATKAFPISAIVYLIYRRHWKATFAALAGLVIILAVLPAPIRGFERNVHELTLWYRGMLADQSGNEIGQRSESGFTYKNQSVFAAVHRLTRHVPAGDHHDAPIYVNLLSFEPYQSQIAAYGVIAGLGMLYLFCMPAWSRQTIASRRCEEAMLLLMVVICSPLAWTYFFCWSLPAWIVIVHALTDPSTATAVRRWGWCTAAVIGAVTASAITQNFDQTAQAHSATFWGAAGLFFFLSGMLYKRSCDDPCARVTNLLWGRQTGKRNVCPTAIKQNAQRIDFPCRTDFLVRPSALTD